MIRITERQLADITVNIIKEKQTECEKRSQEFRGINSETLMREVSEYLGDEWTVIKEQDVKFTKADINAVAGARFFRKGGLTLLMAMLILVLGASLIPRYVGMEMTPLNVTIIYSILGVIFLVFMWIYNKGQSKIRKELWGQLGREESIEK